MSNQIPPDIAAQLLAAHLQAEGERLVQAIPEWGEDAEKAVAEMAELRRFAAERKLYPPHMIDGPILDHRTVLRVREMRDFEQQEAERKAAEAQAEQKNAERARKAAATRESQARAAAEQKRAQEEAANRRQNRFSSRLQKAKGVDDRIEAIGDFLDGRDDGVCRHGVAVGENYECGLCRAGY